MPQRSNRSLEGSPRVLVSLLGGLRVERPDSPPITRFQTRKTASLLAYLALFPGRAHSREFLTELFWPDTKLEDGRRSFRTALASLRRQLEPPGTPMGTVLVADRISVQLNSASLETDTARFEAACLPEGRLNFPQEEQQIEAALAWYAGPLLPGFYDDWASGERVRLADLFSNLLLHRAVVAERQGNLEVALDYARRAVNLEQDHEAMGTQEIHQPAHVAIIRLLARTGRTEDAHQHYDVLAQRLRDLLNEAPSPEARHALAPGPLLKELTRAPAPSTPAPVERLIRFPRPLTRFYGRGPERDLLANLFTDPPTRLVSLTGPGGTGKTRLAIEWARHFSEVFPTTLVCFVPLTELPHASYLWSAITLVLGRERLPDPRATRTQVCEVLHQAQNPLLVLDNFDTWVDLCAPLVEHLLQAVPHLRVLVTSRQRLQIAGEQEIVVAPLPVPTLPGTPERLLEWASVQLFVDRARAARPDFQMTPRNAERVAALCQRLEGMPLALELTAAWAGALSISQMQERIHYHLLDEAGPPLAYQRAQRPARHRTLRAAVNSSFSLLPQALQTAFAQLSVFRGGWTLEAAASVLANAPLPAADLLSRLRERSLLVAEAGIDGDSLRFRLLDSLREFAEEALPRVACEPIQAAHAAYFLQLVEAMLPQRSGPLAKTLLDRLEDEYENIHAALGYFLESSQEKVLRLAGAMAHFWTLRGYWAEGQAWLNRALVGSEDTSELAPLRAHAHLSTGRIAYQQGAFPVARLAYEKALAIWYELGNTSQIAVLLTALAGIAYHADNDYAHARSLIETNLTLQRKVANVAGVATALAALATLAEEEGDYPDARSCLDECLRLEHALGNQENQANALFSLGNIAYHENQLDEAQSRYEESLRLQLDLGNRQRVGHSWQGLGNVATHREDYTTARVCYEKSLQIAQQLGDSWATAILFNNLGKLAYFEHDLGHAWSLCSDSLQMRVASGDRSGAARVLENLALIATAQPSTQRYATTLLGGAHRLREQLHVPIAAGLREEHDTCVATLRASLGELSFDGAWERGLLLPFDDFITFTLSGI